MKKKVLITGCSHVSGHGFDDNLAGALRSKHAWPAMVAQDFDVEVINYSIAGASPDYCVEGIQNFEDKSSLSAILVMLPHSNRSLQSITLDNGTVEDEYYHHGFTGPSQRWNQIMAAYYKVCHNWRVDNINLLAYAGYLNFISTTYKIPLWLTSSTFNDYEMLVKHNIQMSTPTDWQSYCTANKFPRLSDGHFAHEAHFNFYRKFVNPWLTVNLN